MWQDLLLNYCIYSFYLSIQKERREKKNTFYKVFCSSVDSLVKKTPQTKNLTLKLKLNVIENDFAVLNLLDILVLRLSKIWIEKITSMAFQ